MEVSSGRSHFPADVAELLPHRGTMLLLDELIESSPDFAVGVSVVTSTNPFLDSTGKLNSVCFVELLAQLAGASEAINAITRGDSEPVSGYLVGVNDFFITGRAVVGDALQLKIRRLMSINNVTVLEGDVFCGGGRLASGRLKLYNAKGGPNPPAPAPVSGLAAGSPGHPIGGAVSSHILKNMKVADLSREAGTATGEFCFQADFPGFDGHFPGNPIVPGIVLAAMSKAVSEALCGAPLTLSALSHAKFSKLVLPSETVTVVVSHSATGGGYSARSQLTSAGKPVATIEYSVVKEKTDCEK
jgi:3-hydroxymyristoyl/3-hydroxydecanoyl-(acyl carrier protein) dehydratase